jgi:fimbrial isopeptide formation D2 family protein/LPXTG-motif cell wall-anchored protein
LSAEAQSALKTWAGTQTATKTGAGTGGTLVISDLPYGYYVLTTTKNTSNDTNATTSTNTNTYDAIIVTSLNPNAQVYEKNDTKPSQSNTDPYKQVTNATDNTNVAVGDIVNFTVKFAAVNYVGSGTSATQVQNYTISDKGTNLSIDTTSIVVKIGGVTKTVETDYTITPASDDNDKTVTITIPWATNGFSKYDEGSTVEVTYNAEVLHGAVTGTETQNSVKNNAIIKYDDTPLNGTGTEVPLTTKNMTITKTNDRGQTLTGAKFQLYEGTSTTAIQLVQDSTGVYHKADSVEIADTNVTKVTEFEVNTSGTVEIKGLDIDKIYYIEETVAPTAYNRITEKQRVLRNNETNTNGTVTTNTDDQNNEIVATDFTDPTVVNVKGSTLPTTGGMGTTIFYVAGGILVVAALVVLITKKRMDAQN